jgi:hypothetical protein
MATTAQMKSAILDLTGKDLSNAVLLNVATLYCESWGSQWTVDANPYDPETEPTEYADWPASATPAHVADFMGDRTVSHWKSRVWRARKAQRVTEDEPAQNSDAQAAADQL